MRNMLKTKTAVLVACLAAATGAGVAFGGSVDDEFAFASGLVTYEPSFPEFAQKVVDALLRKDPSLAERAKIVQAEILMKRRQFEEVEKLLAEMGESNPKAQAISLSLGWNYFAIGQTDKAKALYDGFFRQYEGKTPTDPDVKMRYRDAAYRYAQMLEMAGDYMGASACYKRVEDVEESKSVKRSMMLNRAQMLVEAAKQKGGDERNKLLDEAEKLCRELQWGGLDLQFVDSVVAQANVQLARGNKDAARKLLADNMDIIKPIDDTLAQMGLPMKESPMAGARSLNGQLLKEDADQAAAEGRNDDAMGLYGQALKEYYNVFVKYGDSSWGPTAGMMAKEIKGILETKYGKTVKIELPDSLAGQAAGTEFMMADNLFRQGKYGEAASEYVRVLGQFPEAQELSVSAVAQLLQCYMNLGDDLYAKMAANYLGERFASKSSIPAKGLASAGSLYDKKATKAGDPDEKAKCEAMSKYIFDCYLKYCPGDAKAAQILFWLAAKAEQAGDVAEANGYLAKIITDYPESAQYTQALSKRAWKSYMEKDYEGALGGMQKFIEESTPSPNLAQAMFALGDCYRAQSNYVAAVKEFKGLVDALTPENNPYGNSAEDVARNQKLLEQTRFYQAFCMSRISMPDEAKAKAVKQASVKLLDSFLKDYPKSDLGAKALNLMGALQMATGDAGANETYARLARDYPDTEEGKHAQYARINGALELGQFAQAQDALNSMLADAKHYSVDEFTRVGQAMAGKQQWAAAEKAFQQVVDREGELAGRNEREQRSVMERSLYGLGEAQYEQGNAAPALATLNELMRRWPASGMFFKAKFIQARAAQASGDKSSAMLALKDIFSRATEPELVNDAKLIYASLLLEGDDPQQSAALAVYKGMEFFGSETMKGETERHQIAQAILEAIKLGEAMERWSDVLESCDTYLKLFPTGADVKTVQTMKVKAAMNAASEASSSDAPAAPAPASGEG